MSALASPSRMPPAVPDWPIYRLTVDDYERMTQVGVVGEDDAVELLEGCLVPKIPKNPLHDSTIKMLEEALARILKAGWHIRGQSVLITPDSAPEPDLAITRGLSRDYRTRHPRGADVALVIEVADSSVQRDRDKTKIYARAGVPEYWIVNLDDWQLERMTQPQSYSTFGNTEILKADGSVRLVLDGHTVGHLPLTKILTPAA